MSYEGYVKKMCSKGHVSAWDASEEEWEEHRLGKCRCGAEFVARLAVDQTNGFSSYVELKEADPDLIVDVPAVTVICNLGEAHITEEARYKIPGPPWRMIK